MTDKIDHAGNLTILAEQIDRGVKLNDSGRVRMAASYIRQLEGLVRAATPSIKGYDHHSYSPAANFAAEWLNAARALGLMEE